MLSNYLKVILRNFISDKMYSFIIIFGLAVGIATSLMIAQYVHFELSFDKQFQNNGQVYYTYIRCGSAQGTFDMRCHPSIGPLLQRKVPEVISFARVAPVGLDWGDEFVLRREQENNSPRYSKEDGLYYADPAILDIFSIPLLEGNPAKALSGINTMVITKSLAEKFFPGESALNKTLRMQTNYGMREYDISGITSDPPLNSSLQYKTLFSIEDLDVVYWKNSRRKTEDVWDHFLYGTYVKVVEAADPELIQTKFNLVVEENFSEREKEFDIKQSLRILPINDLHFYRPVSIGNLDTVRFTGDKRIVIFFIILASLILIISWVNSVNLTTARALNRAKEVGLRKVSGATRTHLVIQFLTEFFVLNLISLGLAFTIAQALFPMFAAAMGSNAEWIFWSEPLFWLGILIFLILFTLASGSYPAFIVSGYSPQKILKGNFSRSSTGTALRKGLVLTQFGFSTLLLVSVYVIYQQQIYMQNKDLGMSIDQVMVIRVADLDTAIDRRIAFQRWKEKGESIDNVKNSSAAWMYPGEQRTRGVGLYVSDDETKEVKYLGPNVISSGFFGTMGMTVIEGRDFMENQPGDADKVIINETAALELGFNGHESCIGSRIMFKKFGRGYEILGVVKDFTTSVKRPARAEVFFNDTWRPSHKFDYFLIKLSSKDITDAVAQVERAWVDLFPDTLFVSFRGK